MGLKNNHFASPNSDTNFIDKGSKHVTELKMIVPCLTLAEVSQTVFKTAFPNIETLKGTVAHYHK